MSRALAFIRRVVSEKRVIVALVGVGLTVDAGLYVLVVYPWILKVDDADRRATAAAANLEAARARFESMRLAADGRVRAEEELHKFQNDVLPRDLAAARALTFARLAALAADHDLLMERRASAVDREEDSRLARLRVSMLLSGAYRTSAGSFTRWRRRRSSSSSRRSS